jgi:hypothetical protein
MTSPNSVFSELVTTTFRKHQKELNDAVSNNNALLRRLYDRGQVKHLDGGLTIVEPLEYAENGTYQRYSGYDILDIGASDVMTSAEFAWRQIAISITASGEDLRKNSGDSRIINLVKSRMKNAIHTFKNNFSVDLYSDGTLPNQINGLQALVADTGLGTVGGINASTWAFWRNKVQSAAAPIQGGGAVTVSETTIEKQIMLPLWLEMVRGSDKPDLIVADNNYYMHFEASQLSLKRYTESGSKTAGFPSLKYKTADVIYDGGSGIPDDHMYFLDTNNLYLVAHKDADMDMMPEVGSYNQDAVVKTILWMGNLAVSNRARQGVAKA